MLKFLIICLVVCCATSAPQNYENQDSFLDRSKWNEERLNRVQIERNIRIVGGSSAQPNQFQHAVALFLKLVNSDSFCGGSIIHPNFIVTAAHCLDDLIEIEVYAGVTNINRGTPPYRAIVPRSDTRQHDTYNRATLRDDIGLVCVRQAIPRTPVMRPVALPSSNLARNSLANQTPFIIGWGRTSDASQGLSNTLQFVQLPVMSDQSCVNIYNTMYEYFVSPNNICISGNRGSTCNGDSGGSATIIQNGVHTLVGIVSFGSHSCEERHPVVLVRVTAYLNWITQNTQIRI